MDANFISSNLPFNPKIRIRTLLLFESKFFNFTNSIASAFYHFSFPTPALTAVSNKVTKNMEVRSLNLQSET